MLRGCRRQGAAEASSSGVGTPARALRLRRANRRSSQAAKRFSEKHSTKYSTSIWRIPATGAQPTRLTQSAQGEDGPAFLPDGSLLFASRRGRTVEIVCPYCESSAIWELEDELPERP